MKQVITRILSIVFLVAAVAFLVLYAYRWYVLSGIPVDDADLGTPEEEFVIPERPGTKSLVLTGPLIKPLRFSINMRTPGMRNLDWSALQDVDFTADVRVTARVNEDGSLNFNPVDDVYCPGHAKAGEMIGNVLSSWTYTPYKTGPVVFRFNVGAIGKKLTIDISKLQRRDGIEPDTPIQDGLLYYIDGGLKGGEVKIKSW